MENSKMVWKGMFGGSLTWNGFKIDLCKSAIQKYIRRGELDKGIWSTIELDLFQLMEKGNGIRSNMINRLKVIAVEEMFNHQILRRMYSLIRDWEKYRMDEKAKSYLLNLVKIMVESPKIRLVSDHKCFLNSDFIIEKYPGKYDQLFETKNNWDSKIRIDYLKSSELNNSNLLEIWSRFIYLIENKDPNCLYWMNKLLQIESSERRYRRKGNEWLVWEYLINSIPKEKFHFNFLETINNLFSLYKDNLREKSLFMISAILYYIKDIEWENSPQMMDLINNKFSDDIVNNYYNINKSNQIIEIDDYICDWHCSEGRKKGKTLLDFAKDGSKVENEDKLFYNQMMRDLYEEYKIYQTEEKEKSKRKKKISPKKTKIRIKKKNKTNTPISNTKIIKNNDIPELELELPFIDWSEFSNFKPCMKGTASNKVMSFSCIYNNKEVVIKEMKSDFSYGRDCMILDEAKELFNIQKIGILRVRCNYIFRRINNKIFEWDNNYQVIESENTIYLIMDKFEGIILNERKNWYKNEDILKEYIRIGIYRGIFRVTDFNTRNVLINIDNLNLCSIDENRIGERKDVLDKKNIKKFKYKMVKDCLDNILENIDQKLPIIEELMKNYEKHNLFENVCLNIENLEKDVMAEIENKDIL